VTGTTPPFAPTRALFAFPGLAAHAARAALGGPREILTGTLMAARLATGLLAPHALPAATRRARAEGATTLLVALTMPAKVRSALQRSFGASAGSNREAVAEALAHVTDITAPHLDRHARSDLVRLMESLRRDGALLAEATDRPVE
jgi:hypothetical protein